MSYNPKRPLIPAFTAMLILLLSGCSGESPHRYGLQEGWSFAPAGPEAKPADLDQEELKPYRMTQNLTVFLPEGESEGYFWLRKTFEIPSRLEGKSLALVLGQPDAAAEYYLNGRRLGSGGGMPPNWYSGWTHYPDFGPAQEHLFQEGENEIRILLYANSFGRLYGKKFLTTREDASAFHRQQQFLLNDLNAWICILLFVMSLYHLAIFLKRREDQENLWYAVLTLAFTVYLTFYFAAESPLKPLISGSYFGFRKLIHLAQAVVGFGTYKFFQKFLDMKDPRWVKTTLLATASLSFLAFLLLPTNQSLTNYSVLIQALTALPPILYILVTLVRGFLQNKKKEVLLLGIGLAPLIFSIFSDIALSRFFEDYVYLSGYGFPVFLFTVLFILGSRFARARTEANDLAAHLEEKVEAQTAALTRLVQKVDKSTEDVFSDMKVVSETLEETDTSSNRMQESAEAVTRENSSQQESISQGVSDMAHIQKEMQNITGVAQRYRQVFEELYNTFTSQMESLETMQKSSADLHQSMETVSENAGSGRETLSHMSESMENINESIEKVKTVTTVIKDIAEQTNVLAINASIEASHAGERGAGFSVVASEVKKLASEVQKNANLSDEIVKTVLGQVEKTTAFTQKAVDELENIMSHFLKTKDFYTDLAKMLDEEFASKKTMADKITTLRDEIQDLLTSLNTEMERVDKTASAFKDLETTSNSIKASTDKQNKDITQVSGMVETVTDSMKKTFAIMSELRSSLTDFNQHMDS